MKTREKLFPAHPEPIHTEEPWIAQWGVIASGTRTIRRTQFSEPMPIARIAPIPEVSDIERDANAARIVACVNAMAGVPIVLLESLKPGALQRILYDYFDMGEEHETDRG